MSDAGNRNQQAVNEQVFLSLPFMKYLRWLLLPFSIIYGLVVSIRNWCYDAGIFKSVKFNKPVISVGNLDIGGAGKSPMTEYLIRLLKSNYKLATLSRGYGRKTTGFLLATPIVKNQDLAPDAHDSSFTNPYPSRSQQVGDEPAQFKNKFPDITVAVCEKRAEGIAQLLPTHDLILLDDAYQHRAVEAGLSILLFDYNRIAEPTFLLPAGNLREPFSGRWRAQIMIITKCPSVLGHEQRTAIYRKIRPLPYQQLFFTTIAYQSLEDLLGQPCRLAMSSDTTVFLLTGIANANPLVEHFRSFTTKIIHHKYPDHHPFTLKNIAKLATEFAACPSEKKIIVTTEKDAQRLDNPLLNGGLLGIPVFVAPIRVEFLNNGGPVFDQLIIDYVREHTAYHRIH